MGRFHPVEGRECRGSELIVGDSEQESKGGECQRGRGARHVVMVW